MLEKPTATSLLQGERFLFPKSFLQPEMSRIESKQINVWSENCLESKNRNEKKKNIFGIFLLNILVWCSRLIRSVGIKRKNRNRSVRQLRAIASVRLSFYPEIKTSYIILLVESR